MHDWSKKIWFLAVSCLALGLQMMGQEIRHASLLAERTGMVKPVFHNLANKDYADIAKPVCYVNESGIKLPRPVFAVEVNLVQPDASDTLDPRMEAYTKALSNARALKKIGRYGLARIEYDRAMRLNTTDGSEILKEKEELPRDENNVDTASYEEVETVPVPGSPEWRYDSVVGLATRQFADKRFDSALANYRLAGQILPEQTFPGSQIRAIEWELAQIWKSYVSARTEKLNKDVRAALAQKKYADALSGLYELMHYNPRDEEWVKTQFANVSRLLTNQGIDTDSILASVKLPDVWDVIAQKRPDLPSSETLDSLNSAAPGSSRSRALLENAPKAKPAASIIQGEAIPYPPAKLAELFPGIDFSKLPSGQALNLIDGPEEHFAVIKRAKSMKPSLQLSDSAGNIKVTCEGLYFNGLNMYLKIRISNNSGSDFPVGPMLLSWKQKARRRVERVPVSISDHPIVQSGKYFSLVYACRSGYIRDDEEMQFSLQGRMGSRKWQIIIPGKVYNQERSKSVNQL